MFQIANLIMGAYFAYRLLSRITMPLVAKIISAAVILGLFEHHWIVSKLFGTSIPSPELPRVVLITLGGVYGMLLIGVILLALKDVAGLVVFIVDKKLGRRLLDSWKLSVFVCVLSAMASSYSVFEAIKVPRVTFIDVKLPHLSAELDGYKLALLTDLHISKLFQQNWVAHVVQKTNELDPDLIVISGDLIDGTPEDRDSDVTPLSTLHAPDGVYAVSGNHEYYAAYKQWLARFSELGIKLLENRHVVIRPERGGFVLAGVPDQVSINFNQNAPDIAKALAGKPQGKPVVLLDHRPGNMRLNAEAGVDLQLSGHTHGGHIRGVDLVVKAFNNGFVSGRYEVGRATLYVSNGAGLWPGLALRLGRPSEITQITLRSEQAIASE